MSKKSSTCASEIGKGIELRTCSGKAERATQGCDLQGITGAKTHTAGVRRKEREPYRFRALSLFAFLENETDLFSTLGDHL